MTVSHKMNNKKRLRIAIVIPAYNEGSVIYDVLKKINNTFARSNYDYKIIVVNDGSKDNTRHEAERAGAYVINHVLNSGSGGATATGLSYAQQNTYDIATTSDADGQHNSNDVLRGVKILEKNGNDLLIGSRLTDSRGMSKVKLLGNKGLSLITSLLFGINVTDSQSGLRIFSKNALNQLKWKTSGYEFCSEMLWRAKQSDLNVSEFPIKAIYTEYSVKKGQNNWNAFNIVKTLISRRLVELFSE